MTRIDKLYLKGFKDPDREVTIEFPKRPLTILYGENGSGKTTLLQVIHAILDGDIGFLQTQKIARFILWYSTTDTAIAMLYVQYCC